MPPGLRNKRFRFVLASAGDNSGSQQHQSFTWTPTYAANKAVSAIATPPRTPVPRTQASSFRVAALSSPQTRTSSRSSSMLTPLVRRSRVSLDADVALQVSGATLIVVPATLIDHWKFQIAAHTREGVLRVLAVTKHAEMRTAAEMGQFDVVLTTFDLLSKEWAVASPSPGSDRWYQLHGTTGRGSQSWRFSPSEYTGVAQQQRACSSAAPPVEASEFQRIQWVRVVLDEGHVMGASSGTNRAMMLGSLAAGAKWICTGTPAPSTPNAELQHMHGLIHALGVQPYANSDVWKCLIHVPFESYDVAAWMRLHAVLSRTMIRSVKSDMERLGEIPSCTVLTTELELSRPEKRAYNGLMTIIKRNIILSESGGSRVDSLLHTKNRKYALEAINNARKACCITGQFNLEIVRAHLEECILDMRRGHSLHAEGCECNGSYFDVPTLKQMHRTDRSGECSLLHDTSRVVPEQRVRNIEEAFSGVGGSGGMRAVVNTEDGHIGCDGCQRLSVFPFITPCGHMICLDCVEEHRQQVFGFLLPTVHIQNCC